MATETINNRIYAQPVGEFKRELVVCLHHAQYTRAPRSNGQDHRAQALEILCTYIRSPRLKTESLQGAGRETSLRESQRHRDGHLVDRNNHLHILFTLLHLNPVSAVYVLQAFTDNLLNIAALMRQTMTYYQCWEMARHKELTKTTGIAVYFFDPCNLRQQNSNENICGLTQQYLPSGVELSAYCREQLDAIADKINNRPRKGLGVRSPLALYTEPLLKSPQHSALVY